MGYSETFVLFSINELQTAVLYVYTKAPTALETRPFSGSRDPSDEEGCRKPALRAVLPALLCVSSLESYIIWTSLTTGSPQRFCVTTNNSELVFQIRQFCIVLV